MHIPFKQYGLKAKGFKCFGDAPEGFDKIKPINVIIGRNNSGKSSLLDLVQHVITGSSIARLGHLGQSPVVIASVPLASENCSDLKLPQRHKYVVHQGKTAEFYTNNIFARILGSNVTFERRNTTGGTFLEFAEPHEDIEPAKLREMGKLICDRIRSDFKTYVFKRILADRDVSPEKSYELTSGSPVLEIKPNGEGVTRAFQAYLDFEDLDRRIVEEKVLADLNSIFSPDAEFERILCERTRSGEYEIKLREGVKGDVPLSSMGSGIKTVLAVLANLYLSPEFRGDVSTWKTGIFAFEELENNLHPAVQRRLFAYLRNLAVNHGCIFFVTTHSSAVIDQFTSDSEAQVLHVAHDGQKSRVTAISTSLGHGAVLDDLDVRASDLLQTNVAIWVEGPSDRIYINRWIELWSDSQLKEGIHYQVLLLGGNCNSHITFDAPNERDAVDGEKLITAFRINRHVVVMHDSDRARESDDLKPVVKRLKEEVAGIGGYFWITEGRNVENYIPIEALRLLAAPNGPDVKSCGKYRDGLTHARNALGGRSLKKTDLARLVAEKLTREMLQPTGDLAEHLSEICHRIRDWNRLPTKRAGTGSRDAQS